MLLTTRTCVLLLLVSPAFSQPVSPEAVLARMDKAAARFQGMSAQVEHVTHTAVINDDSKESGSVKWRKVGTSQIQGLLDFTAPDHKIFLFKDRKLQIYTPSSNTVQVLDLSQYKGEIEQFLMTGFGTPRSEMERAYQITVKDRPVVNGRPTTRLELTPRSPEALKRLTRMELWIPDDADYPIQEKLYQPSGDSNTWIYTDVRINPAPPLKDSDLKLNLPKSVQYVYPQK